MSIFLVTYSFPDTGLPLSTANNVISMTDDEVRKEYDLSIKKLKELYDEENISINMELLGKEILELKTHLT